MDIITLLYEKYNISGLDSDLIKKALTHPSYANEINAPNNHYERLEFMGDAILQFLVSKYIFNTFPNIDEGKMTVLRAKAVREISLANYALQYNLNNYILVGKGEMKTGGQNKRSVLANVFEALLGAIYLSNGLEDCEIYLSPVYKAIVENDFEDIEDYKTKLQEYIQADKKRTVIYELLSSTGTSNNPYFTFRVVMDEIILGIGSGSSKKKAQQKAAKAALDKMVND